MGIWYTSTAMIGYKISLDYFREEYDEKSCKHPESVGKAFCPVCGNKVRSYKRSIWTKEYDILRIDILESGLPDGYVSASDIEENNMLYVGYGVSVDRDDGDAFIKLEDPAVIKATIAELLEPVKDFITLDDENFGLWGTCIGH